MIKSRKSNDEINLTAELKNKLNLYLANVFEKEVLDNIHLFIPRVILSGYLLLIFYTKKLSIIQV